MDIFITACILAVAAWVIWAQVEPEDIAAGRRERWLRRRGLK